MVPILRVDHAQGDGAGLEQLGVAFRVGLGPPEADQVGLVPYLPGGHARVALREHRHAPGEDFRVARRILVLEGRVERRGGDEAGRADQVEHRLHLARLEILDQLVEGGQLVLVLGGFQAVPVQVQAHPLQPQVLQAVDLLVVTLRAEPEELRVDPEEVFPDHRARRLQYLDLGVGGTPPEHQQQYHGEQQRAAAQIESLTCHERFPPCR